MIVHGASVWMPARHIGPVGPAIGDGVLASLQQNPIARAPASVHVWYHFVTVCYDAFSGWCKVIALGSLTSWILSLKGVQNVDGGSSPMAKRPVIVEDRPVEFILPAIATTCHAGALVGIMNVPVRPLSSSPLRSNLVSHVVGDFNLWDPHATPMRTEDGGFFRVTVPLRGTTYYRFVVQQDEASQQRLGRRSLCAGSPLGSSGTEGVLGR